MLVDKKLDFPFYFPGQVTNRTQYVPRHAAGLQDRGRGRQAPPGVPDRRRDGRAGRVLGRPGHDVAGPADPGQPGPDPARQSGRELLLFYDGSKLRMVGWKTPRARVLGVEHARPQDLEFAADRDGSVTAATELVARRESAGPTGNTPVNGAPSARLNVRPRKPRRRRRPSRRAAQSERPLLAQRPQHVRHERRGLVSDLSLRGPLVRRLPRGGRGLSGGTFCIDLRFWYPSRSFDYEKRSAAGLRNKEGEAISAADLRRMNRALWRYGRSSQAIAAGRGDALRPPADGRRRARGGRSEGAVARQPVDLRERAARRGALRRARTRSRPTCPATLTAGRAAEAKVEVLAASGRRVPNVDVALTRHRRRRLRRRVNTGADGVAAVRLTAPRRRDADREGGAAGGSAGAVRPHAGRVGAQRAADRRAGDVTPQRARPRPPCGRSRSSRRRSARRARRRARRSPTR